MERRKWMVVAEEGEIKKRIIGLGTGSLTSFEIAYNLRQTEKHPEWAKKGTMTRNFQSVKWAREEHIQKVVDEAKKEFEPFYNFRKYMLAQGKIETHQDVHEAYQKYVSEIIPKLKRWFGGESSEG